MGINICCCYRPPCIYQTNVKQFLTLSDADIPCIPSINHTNNFECGSLFCRKCGMLFTIAEVVGLSCFVRKECCIEVCLIPREA